MRILLISYYFPPCGGAAVQRWLRWLPELAKAGIGTTVITTRDGDYPEIDESLLQQVPPEVKVIRTRTPRSGRLWKLLQGRKSQLPHGSLSYGEQDSAFKKAMIWIRLNLIIPDLRIMWNPAAYRAAVDQIRIAPPDIVITTGPPHSTHLTGLKLTQRFKLRWIADWRDPWSEVYYLKLNPPGRLSLKYHKHLERKVVETADLNLVVSQSIADRLPPGNKTVIYNGFDEFEMKALAAELQSAQTQGDGLFRIKFIGQLTAGQDLATILKVISEALQDKEFELSFIGTRLSAEHRKLIKTSLPDKVRFKDFVPHSEALKEMMTAELLILLINYYEGFEGMLTTKLFEYLGSGTAILALGPHGGEAEQIITQYQAGAYFDKDEVGEAVFFVRDQYQHRASTKKARDRSALSSQVQALRLIEALEQKKQLTGNSII